MDVFKRALLSLVPVLMLLGGGQANAQVNVTGGYVCLGHCAQPGMCARAYVDGWAGRNHISLYNDVGSPAEGAYATPTRIVAPAWGMTGVVYPNQIVWYRPGSRFPYARWV